MPTLPTTGVSSPRGQSAVPKDPDEVVEIGTTSFFTSDSSHGLVIPTGRVNKSRRKRGQNTVPEFSGYNASLEFLSKAFDLVGVVAHKGASNTANSGRHELEIGMETLPTIFARALRNNMGSGFHTKSDMWKQTVQDSLRQSVQELGLVNNKCSGNWCVVVICRMGGDGSTKPSWMVTSCSQGSTQVVLLAGEANDTVTGEPIVGPTCMQLTGNKSVIPAGTEPHLGQVLGEPDQQLRVILRASAHVDAKTSFTDSRELSILSKMYSALGENLPVSGRSAMRQMVEAGMSDQCMVMVDLLPFSRLASSAEQSDGKLTLPFHSLPGFCGLWQGKVATDALTEKSGRRLKTGAMASAVLLTADFET